MPLRLAKTDRRGAFSNPRADMLSEDGAWWYLITADAEPNINAVSLVSCIWHALIIDNLVNPDRWDSLDPQSWWPSDIGNWGIDHAPIGQDEAGFVLSLREPTTGKNAIVTLSRDHGILLEVVDVQTSDEAGFSFSGGLQASTTVRFGDTTKLILVGSASHWSSPEHETGFLSFDIGRDGQISEPVATPLADLGIRDAPRSRAALTLGDQGLLLITDRDVYIPTSDHHSSGRLSLLVAKEDGRLRKLDDIGTFGDLEGGSVIDAEVLFGSGYVFTSAGEYSRHHGLAVWRVDEDQTLELLNFVDPTRLAGHVGGNGIMSIAAFTMEGRAFLALTSAGFADTRALAILEMLENGALRYLEGADPALYPIIDVEALSHDGHTFLIAEQAEIEALGDDRDDLDIFEFKPDPEPQASAASQAAQLLDGTDRGDLLRAGRGNDIVDGKRGHDVLHGGADDDILIGGGGKDDLDGGAGTDQLFGDAGDDHLTGAWQDDDVLMGGAGDDKLVGGGLLGGGDGRDRLVRGVIQDGGDGDDVLRAGAETKQMFGRDGDDKLFGAEDADGLLLDGGDGDDLILGTRRGETLVDGAGQDTLSGGRGARRSSDFDIEDEFIMLKDGERDKILDFDPGRDLLNLWDFRRLRSFDDLNAEDINAGVKMIIEGEVLILRGISVDDLSPEDISFGLWAY